MTIRRLNRLAVMLSCAAMGMAACSGGPAATSSQTRVTNATDLFQFSVLALAGEKTPRSYTWQNTGPRAQIDVTPAITSGGALLTIRDESGTVLYQEEVRTGIDSLTAAGSPGGVGRPHRLRGHLRVVLVHPDEAGLSPVRGVAGIPPVTPGRGYPGGAPPSAQASTRAATRSR